MDVSFSRCHTFENWNASAVALAGLGLHAEEGGRGMGVHVIRHVKPRELSESDGYTWPSGWPPTYPWLWSPKISTGAELLRGRVYPGGLTVAEFTLWWYPTNHDAGRPCFMVMAGDLRWRFVIQLECSSWHPGTSAYWTWQSKSCYFLWLGSCGFQWTQQSLCESLLEALGPCENKQRCRIHGWKTRPIHWSQRCILFHIQLCVLNGAATYTGLKHGCSWVPWLSSHTSWWVERCWKHSFVFCNS